MRTSLNAVMVAAVLVIGAASCSSHGGSHQPELGVGSETASAATPIAEQCQSVTSIDVVHRVNGRQVTDRLRLNDDAAADPDAALRSFRLAANYFGTDNVVSSQPVSQVHCFPAQATFQTEAAYRRITKLDVPSPGTGLCAGRDEVVSCTPPTPTHAYDFSGTENCTVTDYTGARTVSCEDSSVIVTKSGDVVLTINTERLRTDIAARTQALRRLVGDGNVLTNFHFDVVVTPDQRASLVANDAYNKIAQQIKQASDNGQPLPDIGQILRNLSQPPTSFEFYTQLLEAYRTKQDRLDLLAHITSGNLLSPQQVNAFYQNFVNKSRLVDRLDVQHSASALNQAKEIINDTISQLATTDPSSTIYNQVKAGAQSMLATHAPSGVFDPDHVLDFAVPDLYQSLTNADIEKRLATSQMMIEFNEALRRSDGRGRDLAYAMAGPLGLLTIALQNNDMDTVWRLYDRVQATEFFFDNTNPAGTSFDVHLTPEAQALYNIQVQPNSAVAYEVINLLNDAASYNAATGKLTVNYQAIIAINARAALSANDLNKALFHTEEAYGVSAFLRNAVLPFAGGFAKDLWSNAKGLYWTSIDFWSDPEAWLEHMKGAVVNWRQTMDIMLQQGVDVIRRWPNMTTQERADLLGRIAAEVWLSLPAEAKQAGRLNEAVREATRLHLDRAAHALKVIERGGVALSEEAAVELTKRLERYGITAIDESVEVADALDDLLPCSLVASAPHGALIRAVGTKPPCGVTEIASIFERFGADAAKMGVTIEEEVKDLLASRGIKSPPGEIFRKNLDPAEFAFANEIINSKGGMMIGPIQKNKPAIDGFYLGHPMQLKEITGDIEQVNTWVRKSESKAREFGYRSLDVYIKAVGFTRDQIRTFVEFTVIPRRTQQGIIHAIDILTADGWVHVEGGIVK